MPRAWAPAQASPRSPPTASRPRPSCDHADGELYEAKEGRAPRAAPNRRELSWAATLARAVELRVDPTMANDQSRRNAGYAAAVGQQLGWNGSELGLLRLAAMLHDVGKVSLPDHVLRQADELDPDAHEEVQKHPIVGAQLVERVDGLEAIAPWIRHSHEHFDGSGYPDGLAGEAIPAASRILRVVDTFDSLIGGARALGGRGPGRAACRRRHALRPGMRRGARATPGRHDGGRRARAIDSVQINRGARG